MNTTETSQENIITQPAKLIYTGKTHTTGDRDGGSRMFSDVEFPCLDPSSTV